MEELLTIMEGQPADGDEQLTDLDEQPNDLEVQ